MRCQSILRCIEDKEISVIVRQVNYHNGLSDAISAASTFGLLLRKFKRVNLNFGIRKRGDEF